MLCIYVLQYVIHRTIYNKPTNSIYPRPAGLCIYDMAYITHHTIYNLCSLLPTCVAVAVAAYYYVLTSGPSLLVRVEMGRMMGPYPATIQLLLLSVLGARPYRRRANTSMRVKPTPHHPHTHTILYSYHY